MGTPSAKKLLARAKKGDVDALLACCSVAADDMLEWSSLGQAYLSGADGLPKDEKRARAHLAKIFSEYFPEKKKK